ncbi:MULTISPECIES: hypothetical protein [Streptomyces]|uniref:hypothetical protein n=1 Tax=Streptomyces TaxID=1883 RepID=UPI00106EEB64|nr:MULTISPECIES: hypothetical protein [Streptomyces]MBH5129550.1 hypothetical protein [Streptomyces sp. HB-N217]QPM92754.1 hypothetical protein [Streptomyces sp.]
MGRERATTGARSAGPARRRTGPLGVRPTGTVRRRRGAARIAAAVLLGAVLALPAPAAHADAPEGAVRGGRAPVGLWTGTVTFSGTEIEAVMSFAADGTMCSDQPPGPEGGAEARGRWWRTGTTTFSFHGTERFFDSSGATTGHLRFRHDATLAGASRFTTTGVGTYFDADGNELGTTPATARMNRVGPAPQQC